MKITVEATVKAPIQLVWDAWNNPDDIVKWNAASADWHTTRSTVDLRVGGRITSRMEAKDKSAGFDFSATYTAVEAPRRVAFRLDDARDVVVEFRETPGGVLVTETFDSEPTHGVELQRAGWQAILDSFARHVEAKVAKRA